MRRPSRETLFPAPVPHKAPDPGSRNQLGTPSPPLDTRPAWRGHRGSPGATPLEKPPDAPESAPADSRGSAPHLGSPGAPRGTTARRQPPPGSDTSSPPHRGPCMMQGGAPPAAPSSGRNTQKPGDRSGKTLGPRGHQLGGDQVSPRSAQAEGRRGWLTDVTIAERRCTCASQTRTRETRVTEGPSPPGARRQRLVRSRRPGRFCLVGASGQPRSPPTK